MKTLILIAALIGVSFAASTAKPDVECMSDTDCADLECCYKKHEYLVVSRQTFEGYPLPHSQDLAHTKGVCQSYHNTGDSCTPYDQRNGYCSCNTKRGEYCMASMNGDVHSYQCQAGMLASRK
ncbi:uncharacterized protein LOC128241518 [Mya arenaria]|uniref:uncharacterized protein LOC128241518 n=1 Tax=Mya arenaria TaxID=6604 RepID=UPI0022E50EED|nr:uncharacterized protein LOC128241518 [Mya arenaria]